MKTLDMGTEFGFDPEHVQHTVDVLHEWAEQDKTNVLPDDVLEEWLVLSAAISLLAAKK